MNTKTMIGKEMEAKTQANRHKKRVTAVTQPLLTLNLIL